MIITAQTPTGYSQLDTDKKTLQWLMDNGFGEMVNADEVLNRIDIDRLYESKYLRGFERYCDRQDWDKALRIIQKAVDKGDLTTADYDLVDGILPE